VGTVEERTMRRKRMISRKSEMRKKKRLFQMITWRSVIVVAPRR